MANQDQGNQWPPPEPELPSSGEEILREVERLKREPVRISCLGMSATTLLVVLLVAWLLWRALR